MHLSSVQEPHCLLSLASQPNTSNLLSHLLSELFTSSCLVPLHMTLQKNKKITACKKTLKEQKRRSPRFGHTKYSISPWHASACGSLDHMTETGGSTGAPNRSQEHKLLQTALFFDTVWSVFGLYMSDWVWRTAHLLLIVTLHKREDGVLLPGWYQSLSIKGKTEGKSDIAGF